MSWLQKYLRPTWAKIWATIAGIAVFVSILGGFGDAADRLDTAVDAVLPIGAALIFYGALFGTVLLSGVLVGMVGDWVIDRRRGGPANRDFASMHEKIIRVNKSLSLLEFRMSEHTDVKDRRAIYLKTATEVEVLADALTDKGIRTPPILDRDTPNIGQWMDYLSILEVYASEANHQYAVRHGSNLYGRTEGERQNS